MREAHAGKYFITYSWVFLGILSVYIGVKDIFFSPEHTGVLKDSLFLFAFLTINLIKEILFDLGFEEVDYFYLRSRLIEAILICFAFFFLSYNPWIYVYLFGVVIITTINSGKREGLNTLLVVLILNILFFSITGAAKSRNEAEIITFVFVLVSCFAGWATASRFSWEITERDNKKTAEMRLMQEQREELLKVFKGMDEKNEKIKTKIQHYENENEELKLILNKYFELYNISSVVTSIFDIGGLLKFINETIIEIVESEYSSIFLFETKRGSLEIQKTNIEDEEILQNLQRAINNDMIFDIIENGSLFVVNVADKADYDFVSGRDTKSFVCMPIVTTKKKYGVILIESNQFNKFDDQTQKLITLIGHQISNSIENLEQYKKLRELATTDGLTGVYNRLYFHERLSKELKIAHENDYPVSLVIFDVDHFKKFNDTYSHLIGDRALKVITSVVKNSIRRSDMIARYGGEEFVIIFPNMDIERAGETCELLRKKVEEARVKVRDIELSITASFGVSNYPLNAYSEENLIKTADRALYKAKESGRNRVAISNENLK